MRITNNMMITNMMRNLNQNMLRLDKRQMQFSTGKRIHKPSDDPIGISRSLKIRADVSELDQHRKNVEDATSWLETTELTTRNMGDALHRVRELTVQAANGVLTAEETFKISSEIKELKNQIIGLSNTTYAGKYIFSGKNSDTQLLDHDGNYTVFPYSSKNPNLVDHRMRVEVGVSEMIDINILGIDVLEDISNASSLALGFPKTVGADKATSLKLEGLEVNIEMIGVDQFTATVSVTNEEGNVFTETIPVENTKENVSQWIESTIGTLITTNINDVNHPLNNYNFTAKELKPGQINTDGDWNIVATPQKAGVINLLESIERNMINGNNTELGEQLGQIDKFLNKVLNARADVGAKVNRMELIKNRIIDDRINFKSLQSQIEDADMGEVMMQLMNEENVYRSALSVGAKIIQPSLLDYLR